jgi:hypothetical protein
MFHIPNGTAWRKLTKMGRLALAAELPQGGAESRGPASPTQSRRINFPYALLLVGAVAVVLGGRMFHILSKYSTNIFNGDEWDFRTAQFQGASLWRMFTWQHGPPRLGIGFVVDALLSDLTRWDSRATSLLEGAVMVAAMCCALWLKHRLFGRITLSDVVFPLLLFVPVQFLAFVVTPIVAHGPFPVLLTVLFCLAWTVANIWWRYSLVLVINFLLIYTGFGIFVGFITPLLLGVALFRGIGKPRGWLLPGVALIISLLSLASFFVGYQVGMASGCLVFSPAPLLRYVWYAALIFATLFQLNGHSLLPSLVGFAVLLLNLIVCGWSAYRLLRDRGDVPQNTAIFTFTCLSLLFTVSAAAGRMCRGLDSAHANRYMPYLIPGLTAVYMSLLLVRRPLLRQVGLAVLVFSLLLGATPLRRSVKGPLVSWHHAKQSWKECYLKFEKVDYCDTRMHFKVHPSPAGTHLNEKLQFLKARRLNLYNGD